MLHAKSQSRKGDFQNISFLRSLGSFAANHLLLRASAVNWSENPTKNRMISLNFAFARLFQDIGNIFGELFLVTALQGGDLLIPENKPSDEGLRGFMWAYAGLIGKKYFFNENCHTQKPVVGQQA